MYVCMMIIMAMVLCFFMIHLCFAMHCFSRRGGVDGIKNHACVHSLHIAMTKNRVKRRSGNLETWKVMVFECVGFQCTCIVSGVGQGLHEESTS